MATRNIEREVVEREVSPGILETFFGFLPGEPHIERTTTTWNDDGDKTVVKENIYKK